MNNTLEIINEAIEALNEAKSRIEDALREDNQPELFKGTNEALDKLTIRGEK